MYELLEDHCKVSCHRPASDTDTSTMVQVDVLIDSTSEDGELLGRSQWDAPDVDPFVFISPSDDSRRLPQIGELWRCQITGASLFDLEASPLELLG